MAVQTTYLVGDGNALANTAGGQCFSLNFTIDTATTNVTSGDVLKLLEIPADVKIADVIANVTTAEGGTLTFDVGDYLIADDSAVDADGFLDGVNGNSTGASLASDETLTLTEGDPNTAAFSPAYARGKFYAAATAYLGVLFNNTADAAVINIHVICVNCLDG